MVSAPLESQPQVVLLGAQPLECSALVRAAQIRFGCFGEAAEEVGMTLSHRVVFAGRHESLPGGGTNGFEHPEPLVAPFDKRLVDKTGEHIIDRGWLAFHADHR